MITITSISTAASPSQFVADIVIPLSTFLATSAPQYTITFEAGKPVVSGTSYVVPVKASGTVTYIPKGSCTARTKIFKENFSLGFVSATAPASVTLESTQIGSVPSEIKCCVAKKLKITSLLSLTYPTA